MKSVVMGQKVAMTVPGEETGWDDDRGRPEHVSDDVIVVGRVSHIGRTRPDGDRQIRIYSAGEEDMITETWGWLSNCE